jgi:hypothetical protein
MEEDDFRVDREGGMHMFDDFRVDGDDDDENLQGGEEIGKQVAEAGVRRPTWVEVSAINTLKNLEVTRLTDEDLEHAFKKSSRVRVKSDKTVKKSSRARLDLQVKVRAFKSKCSIASSLSDESHTPILLRPSVYRCTRKHADLEHKLQNRTGHHDEAGVIYTRARKVQSKYILSVPESSGGGEGQKSSVVRVCFANSVKEKKRFSRKALVNKEHYPERAMLHDSVKRKDVMAVQREAVLRSMWHE